MPVISRNSVELYYESIGHGTPLVILHGFMGTLEQNYFWLPLLPGYHQILIDARGHGKSGKPHDPSAYTLPERMLDVIAILDHLAIKKSFYMGYSMGGWVGLGLASAYSNRFYSIVAGGIGPDALNPEESRFWREPMIEALKDGMAKYCQRVEEAENRIMSEEERAHYFAQDNEALIAQLSLEEELDFRYSLTDSDVELLIYVGELDMHHNSAKDFCEGLPNAQFLSIPGCDHGSAAEPQDFLVTKIIHFLEANENA